MNREIHLTAGNVSVRAQQNESATASAVWAALPLQAVASRWGDEIYSSIPVHLAKELGARQDMAVGELGYWRVGTAGYIYSDLCRCSVRLVNQPAEPAHANYVTASAV
jgi:uncharacterized protein